MKIKLLTIGLLTITSVFGQINMADSTVQAIGYWEKNEMQSYVLTIDKIKIKGVDTTSRDFIKYDVDIKVIDSTETSYLLEWHYKNFTVDSKNEIMQKVMTLAEDMKVVVKTNELGVFEGVENWKEVRDYMKRMTSKLSKEYKDAPTMVKLLKQIETTYSTKEAIETNSINEIHQFLTFHGGKYKLGEEYDGKLKVHNLYGGEPFDTDFTMYLDTIQQEDNNYILRATQTVNPEQLKEATYNYICLTMKTMGMPAPSKDDLKDISNETFTASRIHGTGWLIYSIQTKVVKSDQTENIDETIIEIK